MQEQISRANKAAWETKAYQAWMRKNGTPDQQAQRLMRDPQQPLRYWLKYMGNPSGQRVLNLLGSHGEGAICLALLGAEVTIVDISEANRRYAMDVAAASGVSLNYVCADAVNIPDEAALGAFDVVLMEFGVLHYFADLGSIFSVVHRRLRESGRLMLTDFHPVVRTWVSTSLLPTPSGIYFDDAIHEGTVAFARLLPEEERAGLKSVLTRGWTVGEIVTAVASPGMFIRTFEEIPSAENPKVPEFYTLIADRVDAPLQPLHP